jgi:[glutamine synthetase] adenylyltransferase / [glutamine synthetase]-adenylyl-L-tyrosine phosphorylase
LGKEDIRSTFAALTNIAEVCLERIAIAEYDKLSAKLGAPTIGEGPLAGQACSWTILGMGKLGGQELDFHSDLDVVFLYEAEGSTAHARRRQGETTNNQHFFSELGQRIIKIANRLSPYGRLYEVDPRLRPTGRSGALATSFAEFARYFAEGSGHLWERQALTKARPVFSTGDVAARATELFVQAAYEHSWQATYAAEIQAMRRRLEEGAPRGNLKRGPGGIVDIEFTVQMLQLAHGGKHAAVRVANTLAALAVLPTVGVLAAKDADFLTKSYCYLRSVECGLRLMNSTARNTLPQDALELAKLAQRQGAASPQALLDQCQEYMAGNRERFERIFAAAAAAR